LGENLGDPIESARDSDGDFRERLLDRERARDCVCVGVPMKQDEGAAVF
jgi:hypothetical protein